MVELKRDIVPDWLLGRSIISENIEIIKSYLNEQINSELKARVGNSLSEFIQKLGGDGLLPLFSTLVLAPKYQILREAIEDVLFAYTCLITTIAGSLDIHELPVCNKAEEYVSYLKENTTNDKLILEDIINKKFNKIVFENIY